MEKMEMFVACGEVQEARRGGDCVLVLASPSLFAVRLLVRERSERERGLLCNV